MPTHITIPLHDIGKYQIFKQPLSSATNHHAADCAAAVLLTTTATTILADDGASSNISTTNHSTTSTISTVSREIWPVQQQELPTQQAQQQPVVVGVKRGRHQECHHHQQNYYSNKNAGAPTTTTTTSPPETEATAATAPNKKPRTYEWMSTTQKEEQRPCLLPISSKVFESSTGIKIKEEHEQHPPPQQKQDNKFYENNTDGRGCKAGTKISEEAPVATYINKEPNEDDLKTTTTERAATRTISPVEEGSLPGPAGGEIPPATRIMYHPHTNAEPLIRGVPHSPDVLTPSLYSSPDTARTNFISSMCTTVGTHGASAGAGALSRNVLPPNSINSDTGASANGGKMAGQEHQAFLTTIQRHVYFVPHYPPFHYQAPPQSDPPPPPPPPPPSPCVATRIQRKGNYYRSIDSSQLQLMTHMRKMAIELMGSLPAAETSMASSCLARPRENGFRESGTVDIPTFLKNIGHDPVFENHVKQQENIQGIEHSSKIASMTCRCKLKVRNVGHSRFKGAKCDPVTGKKMQNKFRTKGEEISKINARTYFVLLKKSFKERSKGFSLPLETDHWDAILPTIYNAFGPGFHDRQSLPEYSKGDEVPLALPTRLNKLPIEYTKIGETLGLKTCSCKLRREKSRKFGC